jgi:LemA protein
MNAGRIREAVAMVVLVVLVVLAVVVAVAAVVAFNRLVRYRNLVADGWAGIDVQLTRRAELVPNLVEVVKGYRVHEAQTLEQVTQARNRAQQASGPAEAGKADEQLQRSVGSLLAVAEAYPDLKANTNFLDLQKELATLEEDLAFARQYYNAVVRKYNTLQETFPVVLIAGPLGFRQSEYFQADADSRHAPDVAA